MSTLRFASFLLFTLTLASHASADELGLVNGDRLTGTVVRLAGGTLTFKTAHGQLEIPWSDVKSLRLSQPLLITVGEAPAALATIDTAAGTAPPLADVVAIETPTPPLQLDGGASAGLLTTGGNTDVNNLRADGELIARRPRDRYTTTAVVNRAEDTDRETARNWTTSFAYDRFLSERLFLQGSAILTNDRFKDLDLRTAIGAGLGYQFWETPAATLSVTGGVGFVDENFATAPDDSYSALREGTKLDVFLGRRRVQAFHHHDAFFGVTGEDNLFFRMQNGVRLALVAGFVTTAQIDVDYDRSPAPGRVNTDRNFALTFGYRF